MLPEGMDPKLKRSSCGLTTVLQATRAVGIYNIICMNRFAEEDACLLGPHARSSKPQNIICIQSVRRFLYLVSWLLLRHCGTLFGAILRKELRA